jgi:hypothetical protein
LTALGLDGEILRKRRVSSKERILREPKPKFTDIISHLHSN